MNCEFFPLKFRCLTLIFNFNFVCFSGFKYYVYTNGYNSDDGETSVDNLFELFEVADYDNESMCYNEATSITTLWM